MMKGIRMKDSGDGKEQVLRTMAEAELGEFGALWEAGKKENDVSRFLSI